jgi:hypothetical protein
MKCRRSTCVNVRVCRNRAVMSPCASRGRKGRNSDCANQATPLRGRSYSVRLPIAINSGTACTLRVQYRRFVAELWSRRLPDTTASAGATPVTVRQCQRRKSCAASCGDSSLPSSPWTNSSVSMSLWTIRADVSPVATSWAITNGVALVCELPPRPHCPSLPKLGCAYWEREPDEHRETLMRMLADAQRKKLLAG